MTCGRGAQQALRESWEGDVRWTDEQILGNDLTKAFSGFSICFAEIVQSKVGLVDDIFLGEVEASSSKVALWIFSNISDCGSYIMD